MYGKQRILVVVLLVSPWRVQAEPVLNSSPDMATVVQQAYLATHDGWSADDVVIHDERNRSFLAYCRQTLPMAAELELNVCLLNLRKRNDLPASVTRRGRERHGAYRHAAEIASRIMIDRHGQSIDRILCDPVLRTEFDKSAQEMAPEVDAYRLRKAALALRKARQLRPELIVRVAEWGRTVHTYSIASLAKAGDWQEVPEGPGVYLFRDRTGYLYIGEAANVRRRLQDHLLQSDRPTLAQYLRDRRTEGEIIIEVHAFDPTSPARQARMRRAYESELIASRQPRFNVRP